MFEAVVNEIANRINEVEFNPVNKPYSTREKYTKPRTRNRKSADQERFIYVKIITVTHPNTVIPS